MKANEFVKNFGLEASKNIIEGWIYKDFDDSYHISEGIYCNLPFEPTSDCGTICLHDLKLLVESHEVVEQLGGLSEANNRLLHLGIIEDFEKIDELMKAIADVESCQKLEGE